MARFERIELIDLLSRLGAEHDADALDAARALHRKIGETGLTWDQLLRTEADAAFVDTHAIESEPIDVAADGGPATASSAPLDLPEAARLVDRLLAHSTISDTLREDLTAMKGDIEKGQFDAMDARYVGALTKRLGA